MVSGKPPRHSKPTAEPVTIDLEAKDVKAIGTDNHTEPQDAKAASKATSDANPAPVWDQKPVTPIEPEPNVQKPDDTQAKTDKPDTAASPVKTPEKVSSTASAATSATSTPRTTVPPTASASASSTGKSAEPKPSPTASATAPKSPTSSSGKSPATSSLVAAGIVGGIIALLAAGSMQYAGYLPPFAAGGGTERDAITSLSADIASLRQQISSQSNGAASFDASGLEGRIAALESGTAGAGGANLTALDEKIAALESALGTLQSEKTVQDAASAELARRLTEAETKLNEPRDDIEVARAIASAALKSAIDRGGPFLTELDTLSGVTPDDPAVASLRPFAATGVPSRAELMRDYPDVANAMLGAINQPDPNQGVFERLTDSALSLVKVRPVGNIEGESPDAIIARMENKLRNGDLQGASLEWDSLPQPAKDASTAYKQSLDARLEVENLVNGTLSRAITKTGQQG